MLVTIRATDYALLPADLKDRLHRAATAPPTLHLNHLYLWLRDDRWDRLAHAIAALAPVQPGLPFIDPAAPATAAPQD
jgi:hypothetical protein